MLEDILKAIREYLHMDVAFLSEFTGGKRVFRMVDADDINTPVAVGAGDPLEETYCQRVTDCRLPQILPDASANPESAALPITQQLRIGAYVGVPVMLSDGALYGTFCCYRHQPDATLSDRDLGLLRVFANLAARQIEHDAQAARQRQESCERINALLAARELSVVYQPICDIVSQRTVGLEALSRFATLPARTPDLWFAEAYGIGIGETLETAAIRLALTALDHFPDEIYISVNASPEVVLSGALIPEIAGLPAERIAVEITEHALVTRYDDLLAALAPLRQAGVRIAVDDAGAGHSSLRHILQIAPDIIKLDVSLTRNIDKDASRRAMAAALAGFAKETGATMVAEGIETHAELSTLTRIGIPLAQGFLLGKPASQEEAVSKIQRQRDLVDGCRLRGQA